MASSTRKRQRDRPRIIVNGRPLTPLQARRLRAAGEDLACGEPDRIRRGTLALRALEAELAAEQAALEVRAGLDETAHLERTRGERIEVSAAAESRGRIHVRSRDGLETLARSGGITATQHRAGLIYRSLYEATDPERGLKSHMDDLDRRGGGGGPGDLAEAWAERRLRLARTIAGLEAKVRLADRNDRAVAALREVAGHARCLAQLATGGGAQAAYRRALVLALEVCAEHFRL